MLERTEKRWPSDAFSYKERWGWTRVSGATAPSGHRKRDYRIPQKQKFKRSSAQDETLHTWDSFVNFIVLTVWGRSTPYSIEASISSRVQRNHISTF